MDGFDDNNTVQLNATRPQSSLGRPATASSRPTSSMGRPMSSSIRNVGAPSSTNEQPPNSDQTTVASRLANEVSTLQLRPQMPSMTGLSGFINNFGTNFSSRINSLFSFNLAICGGGDGMFSNLLNRINSLYSAKFGMSLFQPSYTTGRQDEFNMFQDFLITTSKDSSVQYYSQDPFENLKFKVTIRCVKSFVQHSQSSVTKQQTEEDKQQSILHDESEDDEQSFIFSWQQKVFSPRELVQYYTMKTPKTMLERQYKKETKKLISTVEKSDIANDKLRAYIQEKDQLLKSIKFQKQTGQHAIFNKKKDKKKKDKKKNKKKKKKGSDDEDQENIQEHEPEQQKPQEEQISLEDEEPPPEPTMEATKVWGANGFLDLLSHRLSTFVDVDGFESNTIQEAIECSAKEPYDFNPFVNVDIPPDRLTATDGDNSRIKRSSSRTKCMYIMANFGDVKRNGIDTMEIEDWIGTEYVLCVIQVMPDGSFIMKPGLSMIPEDDPNNVLVQSDHVKRMKEQQALLKKQSEKKYVFRAKSGQVYEYTIHLHNEFHKDPELEKQRKEIVETMNERSLSMRRNLVGQEFCIAPPSSNDTRVHVLGELVSATNFDARKIYVRYISDFPSGYKLEDKSQSQRTVSSTQISMAIQRRMTSGWQSYYGFGFPFEFHMLSSQIHPTPVLYFVVYSVDSWNRTKVEGYSHISIPAVAGDYTMEISCWKPSGSIRENMRSFFVGGTPELNDISYIGIPKQFNNRFLNKFGYVTQTSGNLQIRIQVITQSNDRKQQTLWKFQDHEPSSKIIKKAMEGADQIRREEGILDEEQLQDQLMELPPSRPPSRPSTATTNRPSSSYSAVQRVNLTSPREKIDHVLDEEDIQEDDLDVEQSTTVEEFRRPRTSPFTSSGMEPSSNSSLRQRPNTGYIQKKS
jgi:hypothetical protein